MISAFLGKPVTLILIMVLSLIFILLDLFYLRMNRFNHFVRHTVNRTRNHEIRRLMIMTHKFNDVMQSSVQIIVVAALLGFIWKDWMSGFFLVSAISLQTAVVSLTKQVVIRARPPHLTAHKIMTSGSYPSGHSASTMAMAFLVSLFFLPYLPLWGTCIIFLMMFCNAIFTAYGRLYLDMHWATDILGGWILAVLTILVTLMIKNYAVS